MVALNLDKARLEQKLGGYLAGPATVLADPAIHLRTQEYRRLAGGRFTPIGKEDIAAKMPQGEYHLSRKVDGEFTVLAWDGKNVLTINPGGTLRMGLPLMKEAAELLAKAKVKSALVAGELYVKRPDGKRARIHDVSRIARQPENEDELGQLRFAVFDLLDLDGQPAEGPYAETWKLILKIFKSGERVHPVETVTVKKTKEIEEKFEEWVEKEGEEGLVARSESAGLFKIKPRHNVDAAVVGFTESTDDRKGMLHDLLVALMRQDGSYHLFARVGGGFSEDERRGFFSDLKDMVVESEYAEVNPNHVAYEMVRPEWVVEVSCLDYISQTTRGGSIDRMVLNWNGEKPGYEVIRRLPLVSAISPQFVRRREDKGVNPSDLRLSQIADLVEVRMAERNARQLTLPKSELLKREVFVKAAKGNTMVRKFLLWKTNKETDSDLYPGYVVHFTDFSPNRKTPLERELRVSHNREQIEALYTHLKDENVLKGWRPA